MRTVKVLLAQRRRAQYTLPQTAEAKQVRDELKAKLYTALLMGRLQRGV
jgi:hypothetical protein